MGIGDNNRPSAGGHAPLKSALKVPTGPAAQRGGPWSSGQDNNLKSGMADARNPSHAPRGKSVMMADQPELRANTRKAPDAQDWRATGTYNPSLGPTRSTMTTKWRNTNAPSRATDRTRRQAFENAVCKMSNYTRRDFKLGDVIAAPFHTANTDPECNPRDARLTWTCEGPAYSKRRMMVVLFIHQYDLFCLPLWSFSGRGLIVKPQHVKREYVCMKNVGAVGFVNQGVHTPVEIQARHPVTPTTTVHIAGGLRVGCNEDITPVGRLTEKTYYNLVAVWKKITGEAQEEGW